MERKRAHQLLFEWLPAPDRSALKSMETRVEQHLVLPRQEREAGAEALFADLAAFTANALLETRGL